MAAGFIDFLRGILGWWSATPDTSGRFVSGSMEATNVQTGAMEAINVQAGTLAALNLQTGSMSAAGVLTGEMAAGNVQTGSMGEGDEMAAQNYSCWKGEKLTIDLTDADSTNRSAQTLVCYLRSESFEGTVLATLTVGSGLSFPSNTVLRVVFSASNTNRTRGTYYWTVSRTDSGEETGLAEGTLEILSMSVGA